MNQGDPQWSERLMTSYGIRTLWILWILRYRLIEMSWEKGEIMSNDNGGYGFVAGFFLGAALGAVTALLFAPMTGRELQETLAEERRKLREKADRAEDTRSGGESEAES
jgi:hypothetical protein